MGTAPPPSTPRPWWARGVNDVHGTVGTGAISSSSFFRTGLGSRIQVLSTSRSVIGVCLIGMGSIVLDNVVIHSGSIIGAGAVVTSNTVIPPNSLVLGCPGKVVKTLSESERNKWIGHGHQEYLKLLDEVNEN